MSPRMPMPARSGHLSSKRGPEDVRATIKRLLSYMKLYRFRFILVLFCILFSALAGVIGTMFIQVLIDDYIAPMLLQSEPVFTELLRAITTMACIYGIGILAGFCLLYTSYAVSSVVTAANAPVLRPSEMARTKIRVSKNRTSRLFMASTSSG